MTSPERIAAGEDIVRTARSLFSRRLTHGRTGNLSVRVRQGILVTPTGSSLGTVTVEQLSLVDARGRHLDGPPPSKEAALHAAVLRARPRARAVVHTHSTHAAAVSCLAGLDPDNALPPLTAYFAMRVGRLPLLPYYAPGDRRLARAAEEAARLGPAVLLRNHGPLVAGTSLATALDALEELEETARLFLLLKGMPTRPLTDAEQAALTPPAQRAARRSAPPPREGSELTVLDRNSENHPGSATAQAPAEDDPAQHSVTLFSALAVRKALDEVVLPAFTRSTGVAVNAVFDPTAQLVRRIDAGQPFDVLIGVTDSFHPLVRRRLVAPDTLTALARTGVGLAVAPGAPRPDISTRSALVATLRAARSVAYSRTGASGRYFAGLLDDLGIADEINARATVIEKGFVAEAVVDGRADIAVQQLSELLFVPQADIAGPLPEEVQHYSHLSAILNTGSTRSPAARALLAHLRGPLAAEAYTDTLLEPTAEG
ncbi:3-oxo-tetronate 4-phosphate decarboxylase [Streptomyces sp. CB01201]|uniref:3-oxo-tetronate 4-phosphate decarboxylase n=1 Tax=Streptomyces sp. CB01201 TaxID=2020324 RepID=UPI00267A88D0|nr:3-oxo-tetronate 4-phosphate decarboxylase [Streptomyces sp. CB01201]